MLHCFFISVLFGILFLRIKRGPRDPTRVGRQTGSGINNALVLKEISGKSNAFIHLKEESGQYGCGY
jgi:hypothetical protein